MNPKISKAIDKAQKGTAIPWRAVLALEMVQCSTVPQMRVMRGHAAMQASMSEPWRESPAPQGELPKPSDLEQSAYDGALKYLVKYFNDDCDTY